MLFSEIFHRVRPCLHLGNTVHSYLEHHIDPKTIDDTLAQGISSNPVYWHFFEKVLKVQRGQMNSSLIEEDDDEIRLENPIRFLAFFGKKGSRNFLCALRKMRLLGGHWPRKENDEFNLSLEEMLPKSLELEEYFDAHEIARPKIAFFGGLLFDYFDIALQDNHWSGGAIAESVELKWKEQMRVSRAAYELTRVIPEFQFKDYIFPAALAIGTGQVLFHVLFGLQTPKISWKEFTEKRAYYTLELPELILPYERSVLSVSHNELAGLLLRYFEPTRALERGVWFYREPFFLKEGPVHLYRTALTLYFAHAVSERPRKFKLTSIEKKMLSDLKLDENNLWEAQRVALKIHPKESGA